MRGRLLVGEGMGTGWSEDVRREPESVKQYYRAAARCVVQFVLDLLVRALEREEGSRNTDLRPGIYFWIRTISSFSDYRYK